MAKYILSDIFEGNYPISQRYGNNPNYYKQFGFAGHEGVDWATPTGTKVLAPFDYKIVRDTDDPKSGAYGTHLVCWDPVQKCAVWYAHLLKNNVSINQTGKRGDILGETDNTGNTSGTHLHANFVETDIRGNRLNTNNGYQGFLNILDSNLIEWKLGGLMPNPTIPPSMLPAGFEHYAENWKEMAIQKGLDINASMFTEYRRIDEIIANRLTTSEIEIKSKQDVIDNLNQQINDRNNDIIQLNGQISTLRDQVLNLNTQTDSLSKQAKQVPKLKELLAELEKQKERWTEQEKTYNRIIGQLKKENEDLKKNVLKALFISILEKFDKILGKR